ncbi:GTPase required for pre-60S ribosomal subunit nuclear export and maturation [Tulasnella sp. 424]|nr:GTPase required for pre-60S ribosomal subunit nuclear export and maturation [Tulasnella sp. 424]KAG8975624.1 GTPase required for pre-60S ribosomal subunit nuclear export and maturation [Tulasnella sp. 425]
MSAISPSPMTPQIQQVTLKQTFKTNRSRQGREFLPKGETGGTREDAVGRTGKIIQAAVVISQDALEHFRDAMSERKDDPYSVLLRRNKLPMSLLDDSHAGQKRPHIVETEPFQETALLARKVANDTHDQQENAVELKLQEANVADDGGHLGASYLNGPEPGPRKPAGWAGHGAMSAILSPYNVMPAPVFSKGTSKRIYGEHYKVIDSSDVIIHVLDTCDPLCQSVIVYVNKEKSHKQVVYLINKVDLVSGWVTQRYISHHTPTAPTLAFHASRHHSFGKGAFIQHLRQFAQLHSDREQVSVGFVGYPNVGTSSIINVLKNGKVCSAAPVRGQTNGWQYIIVTRRIYLIDCPGINLIQQSGHVSALLNRSALSASSERTALKALQDESLMFTAKEEDALRDTLAAGSGARTRFACGGEGVLTGGELVRETVVKMNYLKKQEVDAPQDAPTSSAVKATRRDSDEEKQVVAGGQGADEKEWGGVEEAAEDEEVDDKSEDDGSEVDKIEPKKPRRKTRPLGVTYRHLA